MSNLVDKQLVFDNMERLKRKFWKLYDRSEKLCSEMIDNGTSVDDSMSILSDYLDKIKGDFCIVKLYDTNSIDETGATKKGTNHTNVLQFRVSLQDAKQGINLPINSPGGGDQYGDKFFEMYGKMKDMERELELSKLSSSLQKQIDDLKKKNNDEDDGTTKLLTRIAEQMFFAPPAAQPAINTPVHGLPGNKKKKAEVIAPEDKDAAAKQLQKNLSVFSKTPGVGLDALTKIANFIEANPEQAHNFLNMIPGNGQE